MRCGRPAAVRRLATHGVMLEPARARTGTPIQRASQVVVVPLYGVVSRAMSRWGVDKRRGGRRGWWRTGGRSRRLGNFFGLCEGGQVKRDCAETGRCEGGGFEGRRAGGEFSRRTADQSWMQRGEISLMSLNEPKVSVAGSPPTGGADAGGW